MARVTLFALVLLPLTAPLITIPDLLMVYRSATPEIIFEVCGFSAGWGVAQVFFGLAVDMIAITLAFSIVLGTSAAVGSLIPMVSLHRDRLNSLAGFACLERLPLSSWASLSVLSPARQVKERPLDLLPLKRRFRGDCCLLFCAVFARPS
jgi:hypothetical protein